MDFPETRVDLIEDIKEFTRRSHRLHGVYSDPTLIFMPYDMERAVREWVGEEWYRQHWFTPESSVTIFGLRVVRGAPRYTLAWVKDCHDPAEAACQAMVLREYYGIEYPGVVFWPDGREE